ncbi:hypothetical protein, partial [uncultured Comamonas sp.]|uniref:hypothetical protein n=1 Tax=uncultured Comamonas sp. TaxID=114710 RepID=UPI002606FDF0
MNEIGLWRLLGKREQLCFLKFIGLRSGAALLLCARRISNRVQTLNPRTGIALLEFENGKRKIRAYQAPRERGHD